VDGDGANVIYWDYEYFRDKTEILRFEFDRYFEAFSQGAAGVLNPGDTPGTFLGQQIAHLPLQFRDTFAHPDIDAIHIQGTIQQIPVFERIRDGLIGEFRCLRQARL